MKHADRSTAPTQLTSEPMAMGTPAYMAPEAILGEEVDRRADVYALGCVLYFLLTGKILFAADTAMRLLLQHVQQVPLPPSSRTEQSIPRAIDELVMACLQKDPNRRPRDAEELLRLASAPGIPTEWDHHDAQRWWEAHVPQLVKGSAPEVQTEPSTHRQSLLGALRA